MMSLMHARARVLMRLTGLRIMTALTLAGGRAQGQDQLFSNHAEKVNKLRVEMNRGDPRACTWGVQRPAISAIAIKFIKFELDALALLVLHTLPPLVCDSESNHTPRARRLMHPYCTCCMYDDNTHVCVEACEYGGYVDEC